MAGHAQALAGEAQMFLGSGLHIHPRKVNLQIGSNVRHHLFDMGFQLGTLGDR